LGCRVAELGGSHRARYHNWSIYRSELEKLAAPRDYHATTRLFGIVELNEPAQCDLRIWYISEPYNLEDGYYDHIPNLADLRWPAASHEWRTCDSDGRWTTLGYHWHARTTELGWLATASDRRELEL